MRGVVALMVGSLAIAGSAAAAEPSAEPTPGKPALVATPVITEGRIPTKAAAETDPLVCRSETPIGSKLPVKTCIRKSERDRQKRDSQEALQLIQRRGDGPVKIDTP
jgi:hypothetical protein